MLLVNVRLTLLNSHKSFSKLAHRGGKDHSLSLSIAMRRLPSETCSFVSRMMCANDDRPVCASTKTTAEGLAESPGLVAAKIYQHSEVALPTPQPNPTQPNRPAPPEKRLQISTILGFRIRIWRGGWYSSPRLLSPTCAPNP